MISKLRSLLLFFFFTGQKSISLDWIGAKMNFRGWILSRLAGSEQEKLGDLPSLYCLPSKLYILLASVVHSGLSWEMLWLDGSTTSACPAPHFQQRESPPTVALEGNINKFINDISKEEVVNICQFWPFSILLLPSRSITSFAAVGSDANCVWLCDINDCSMPGFPVLHCLLEFAQTHVHWFGDAIQPSHSLLSSSPPAPYLSQHQGLFWWAGPLHQVAKVLELQL